MSGNRNLQSPLLRERLQHIGRAAVGRRWRQRLHCRLPARTPVRWSEPSALRCRGPASSSRRARIYRQAFQDLSGREDDGSADVAASCLGECLGGVGEPTPAVRPWSWERSSYPIPAVRNSRGDRFSSVEPVLPIWRPDRRDVPIESPYRLTRLARSREFWSGYEGRCASPIGPARSRTAGRGPLPSSGGR